MGTERCSFCAVTKEVKDLKRCANCRMVFYCSKECQRLQWKRGHKAVCQLPLTKFSRDLEVDPEEKALWKKVNRWMNAWSPVITVCLPAALDLANHPWGRYETHTLVITVEHTNLTEDAQLFRVAEAAIQPYADIIKLIPEVESAIKSRSGPSEWPRLHCIIFFKDNKDKDDPTRMGRARVHSWGTPNLREVYSDLDKNHSRAVAKQAIPILVSEINGLKKPEEVAKIFHLMIGNPGAARQFLEMLEMAAP